MAGVGQDRSQAGGQVGDQLDVLAEGADQQLLNASDHHVEVQHARLDHLLAGEGQQLMGQPGGPVGGQPDLPDIVADGLPALAGQLPGDFFAGEGGVVGDDAEQVVEVVGDPAGELAQAFQPLRLVQLPLQLVPLGLGPQPLPLGGDLQPLGDVPDGGGDQEPSSVSMAARETSAGKVLPSRRRPASSMSAPIGLGLGSATYSARWPGCRSRTWSGTRISTGWPTSSSLP